MNAFPWEAIPYLIVVLATTMGFDCDTEKWTKRWFAIALLTLASWMFVEVTCVMR